MPFQRFPLVTTRRAAIRCLRAICPKELAVSGVTGPAKHIRVVQTAGAKREDIRASIVNPARLSPALPMDLCMQCHLEPNQH